MLKVLAESPFPFSNKDPYAKQVYGLPVADCTATEIQIDVCLKRCILNLVTIPNLRAAYIFRFNKQHTHWSVYEPTHAPLTQKEVRGALFFTMNEMKRNQESMFRNIKEKPKACIKNTRPIIKEIETIGKFQKVFIILVFKNILFMTGNYYDESSLCHALANFVPRKIQTLNAPTEPNLLVTRKQPDYNIKDVIRKVEEN